VIVAIRIVLAALIGRHSTIGLGDLPIWQSNLLPTMLTLAALALTIQACVRGPDLLRWGCLAAGLSLAAALVSPVPMTGWAAPWVMLSHPDHFARYFVFPMLAWIGVLFTLAADRSVIVRVVGIGLIALLLIELPGDGHLMPLGTTRQRTDFIARARAFADAPIGTRMEFPVHPTGSRPMLILKTN
jgi:hypothetical protein